MKKLLQVLLVVSCCLGVYPLSAQELTANEHIMPPAQSDQALTVPTVTKDNTDLSVNESKASENQIPTNLSSPVQIHTPVLRAFLKGQAKAAAVVIGDDIALFFPSKGKLVFSYKGSENVLADKTTTDSVWLHKTTKYIYALWWDKQSDAKRLYLRVSSDSGKTFSPVSIIAQGGVLPQLSIVDDGHDQLAVTYVTEEFLGYQIYFNRSLDAGKTWLTKPLQLNKLYTSKGEYKLELSEAQKEKDPKDPPGSYVLYHKLYMHQDRWISVWQERAIINGEPYLRIVSRFSTDQGLNWSAETEIYKLANVSPAEMLSIEAMNEGYIFLFIVDHGLLAFQSTDNIHNWKSMGVVPGTEKLTFSSWFKAVRINDKVLLSRVDRAPNEKDVVKVSRYSLTEQKWLEDSSSKKLFETEDNSKLYELKTKSTLQDLKVLNNGTILMVWEDYRYLMPVVMLAVSSNHGDSWSEAKPLTTPGKTVSKFPQLYLGETSLWALFTYLEPSDGSKPSTNFLTGLPIVQDVAGTIRVPAVSIGKQLTREQKLSRLKQRVQEFWKFRVENNHEASWNYFDPLYKEFYGRDNWIKSQGKLLYLDYSFENAEISGFIASVSGKVKFSMNQILLGEEDLVESPPPKDSSLNDRWGWFDDDWYFMPETMFDKRYDY